VKIVRATPYARLLTLVLAAIALGAVAGCDFGRSSPTGSGGPTPDSRGGSATPIELSLSTPPSGTVTPTFTPDASSADAPREARTSPTPRPGAMSVYRIHNPNSVPVVVHHDFTGPGGFRYRLESSVPAGGDAEYHLRDIAEIPNRFSGSVKLSADRAFSAEIIGYDFP
jgi:hypothetical protein